MIQRCTNKNHTHHERYKGLLCEEWLEFDVFLSDMGERPDCTSLDRIDNNLGYFKENCRWASSTEQVRNRSCNVMSKEIGDEIRRLSSEGFKPSEISKTLGLSISNVSNVLHKGYWK